MMASKDTFWGDKWDCSPLLLSVPSSISSISFNDIVSRISYKMKLSQTLSILALLVASAVAVAVPQEKSCTVFLPPPPLPTDMLNHQF